MYVVLRKCLLVCISESTQNSVHTKMCCFVLYAETFVFIKVKKRNKKPEPSLRRKKQARRRLQRIIIIITMMKLVYTMKKVFRLLFFRRRRRLRRRWWWLLFIRCLLSYYNTNLYHLVCIISALARLEFVV